MNVTIRPIALRAAIYARFSTDRQNESSILDQVRVCGEYAQRQGWTVIEHFQDSGISGAAFGNRPGFLAMRAAAMGGKLDVLLIADTTRLARSQELAPLIERFRFQGIRVIGVQDNFDSSNGTADMQAGLSGIMSVEFRRMIKARTHAALETRAKEKRPTGGRCYGYRDGTVDEAQANVVRQIFTLFADGNSARTIAAKLNAKGIASPGSTWNRTERRAAGWMGSGIRAMLLNERYTGRIHWNTSEWRKDPDSGKRARVMRPRSEWITHQDEALRIVSDALFEKVQRRVRPMQGDARLKSGGKPKFLLSGLLICDACQSHYVITDQVSYGCSSFHDGHACSNGVRVRRDRAESILLDPIRNELLAPERVARMAKELQTLYVERQRMMQARETQIPHELRRLNARIERLRERLTNGDNDMEPDEIAVAIERAQAKRQELIQAQPAAKQALKILALVPKAAEEYRRQIALGLEGDPREALKARVILRELFGGKIRLEPLPDGGLMAHWNLNTAALVRSLGSCGSGGRI